MRKTANTRTSKPVDKPVQPVIEAKQAIIPLVYKPFPHPYNALYGDFLRWAERGAYFILHDPNSNTYRHYHKHCEGTYGHANIPEMIEKSKVEPLIVLNLSHYPVLLQEGEWDSYLMRYFPEYRHCICPMAKKILNCQGLSRECYELTGRNYFYLTGLNQEGETCLKYTKLAAYHQ